MSDWTSGEILVSGLSFHYLRTGGERLPLVLCHGITDNAACWEPLARVFENEYDVVMVDARGHGLSASPETGYGPADRVADLVELMDGLGLRKPALLGHSMGADTIARLAAAYPDLPACVVLEDPPWNAQVETAEGQAAVAAEWRAKMLQRKAMSRDEIIVAGRQQHPNWPETEFAPWADSKLQVSLHVLQVMAGIGSGWRQTAAAIRCPALLVRGDPALGGLVGPQVAQELAGIAPGIGVAHLAGAGHSIHRERFDQFVASVRAFLGRQGH